MPRVTLLSDSMNPAEQKAFLQQLPELLQELAMLKCLAVDVKAENFGFYRNVLVATDLDAMMPYDDPQAIPRPLACTLSLAADEIKSGAAFITLQADVQAFARLIRDVVTYGPYQQLLRQILPKALHPLPDARPSYERFIESLKELNLDV